MPITCKRRRKNAAFAGEIPAETETLNNSGTRERMVDMIKIMMISDMEQFLNKVQSCHGDVMLHLPDGTQCNLKSDHIAIQLLKMLHSTNRELDLSLTDARDFPIIMQYMMWSAA